jgi:molecular chaperone HtpG
MSAVASAKTRETKPVETLDIAQVRIGRDVLELVSSAMYVDPMTIYREYLQNAADSIDAARAADVLKKDEPGEVRIELDHDPKARAVRIRDNGAGLPWAEFATTLTAIGASAKRGTSARGFRGVGRLAGLAFAQELIFRSRANGESLISELRWDCRRLKAALRAGEPDEGVEALVRDIVSVARIPATDEPDHFFEVELRGVVRQGADRLMNAYAITDYIAEVGPVPFSPDFRFRAQIVTALGQLSRSEPINVYIDGAGPVHRPHRNEIPIQGGRPIVFHEPVIVSVPGADGGVAAVAWFLHHDYEGGLPNVALVKGLRVRSGDIQIGDHTLLEGLFPEPRFNVWSVGEVHVLDRRLIPNGRRDNFEQNVHLNNLLNHLAPTAKDIARRCRTNSTKRKFLREFQLQRQVATERLSVLTQGGLEGAARDALALEVDQGLLRMEKIAGLKTLLPDEEGELRPVIAGLRNDARAALQEDQQISPLDRLPLAQRGMYKHFIELIYECSTNRAAAKALVDRILLRIA